MTFPPMHRLSANWIWPGRSIYYDPWDGESREDAAIEYSLLSNQYSIFPEKLIPTIPPSGRGQNNEAATGGVGPSCGREVWSLVVYFFPSSCATQHGTTPRNSQELPLFAKTTSSQNHTSNTPRIKKESYTHLTISSSAQSDKTHIPKHHEVIFCNSCLVPPRSYPR